MSRRMHILWAGQPPQGQRTALEALGTVTAAPDLFEAIRVSNDIDFEAAVVDVDSLGEGGITLLRHLRARSSRRFVSVIFWSQHDSVQQRVVAFEAGVDDWVSSTVDPRELCSRLLRGASMRERIDGLLNETQRLYELSLTDGLTQAANHRHFQERLKEEFRRAQRYDDPLALILLDLDHFKDVNDRHGHLVGDELLKSVATVLRKCVRETDFVARYGGEEFALVLPKTQVAGALTVAERVWADVGRIKHPLGFQVTASLGLAGFPSRDITTAEQLVKHADEALYRAKREGRNKIAISQSSELAEAG